MAHQLPSLPYDFAALEPHIDAQTMQIHHGKHHQAYVNNLNAALEKHPALQGKTADELIANLSAVPEDIRTAVRNNGGGHVNHTLFWTLMGAECRRRADRRGGRRDQQRVRQLRRVQGSVRQGRPSAGSAAAGRGWSNTGGKLSIESTPNQDSPMMDGQEADPRPRRVGARLLPEVPEPPARLHHRLVERRELGRSREGLRQVETRRTDHNRDAATPRRRDEPVVVVIALRGLAASCHRGCDRRVTSSSFP